MSTLDQLDARVRAVVDRVASRVLEQGAKAVLLVGSHARGTATDASDVDFFAIGDGPTGRREVVEGTLVAVHWFTPEAVRRRFSDPASALVSVEGWRDAIVVEDPTGVGAELVAEAREWKWETIAREADAWVCDELVEVSEYVSKLARALDDDRFLDAAALRSELSVRLARIAAVAHRVAVESENGLWEAVADAGGREWRDVLAAAFAVDGEEPRASAAAAIRLFQLLVDEIDDRLPDDQRAVIDFATASISNR